MYVNNLFNSHYALSKDDLAQVFPDSPSSCSTQTHKHKPSPKHSYQVLDQSRFHVFSISSGGQSYQVVLFSSCRALYRLCIVFMRQVSATLKRLHSLFAHETIETQQIHGVSPVIRSSYCHTRISGAQTAFKFRWLILWQPYLVQHEGKCLKWVKIFS